MTQENINGHKEVMVTEVSLEEGKSTSVAVRSHVSKSDKTVGSCWLFGLGIDKMLKGEYQ